MLLAGTKMPLKPLRMPERFRETEKFRSQEKELFLRTAENGKKQLKNSIVSLF